jgi:hypothetical protein
VFRETKLDAKRPYAERDYHEHEVQQNVKVYAGSEEFPGIFLELDA